MAVSAVSYTTYITIFFRVGPNTASIFTLLRDFIFYRALDSKFAMAWIIFSASFVAVFPTWVSAMTGYSGNRGAFVTDLNDNFISFSEFEYIEYVVHDGDRLGLSKDYYVTGNFSIGSNNGKAHYTLAIYTWEANTRVDLGSYCDNYDYSAYPGYYEHYGSDIPQDCLFRLEISNCKCAVQPTARQFDL